MPKDSRFRATKRQRGLVKTLLLFSIFLLICIILIMFFLQRGDEGLLSESQKFYSNPGLALEPASGLSKPEWITLYFRLGENSYLVAKNVIVEVPIGVSLEQVALVNLIEGPGASSDLTALLPRSTEVLKCEAIGDTLFVDFSEEITSWPIDNPNIQAREAKMRLIAYSVANTVIDVGRYSQVQILVNGKKPTNASFGFNDDSETADYPLAPLSYFDDIVIDADMTLNLCMDAVKNREWNRLYGFITNSQGSGKQLGDLETLRTEWEALDYRIIGWSVAGTTTGSSGNSEIIRINVEFLFENGRRAQRKALPVKLIRENDIWKLPLDVLMRIMVLPEGS